MGTQDGKRKPQLFIALDPSLATLVDRLHETTGIRSGADLVRHALAELAKKHGIKRSAKSEAA